MVITTRKLTKILPTASRSPNKFKKPSLPNKRVLKSKSTSVSCDNINTEVQIQNVNNHSNSENLNPESKRVRYTHLASSPNNNNNSKTTVIRKNQKISSPKTPRSLQHKSSKPKPAKSKTKNATKYSNKSSTSSNATTTTSISYFNSADFIHSFVPNFKPVSLNDFYSGELDEILRDQSAFILDAQEYQRTKGNQYRKSVKLK